MLFQLKERKRRETGLILSNDPVIATYTLDSSYVAYRTIIEAGEEVSRKVLPLGAVVAFNPATRKVVPNYTSYGFTAVGPIVGDADCGGETLYDVHDTEVGVVWDGVVNQEAVFDNGSFNNVLDATRSALAERVQFVKEKYF